VQQFFEALGLAKAPKVSIDKHALAMHGTPNEFLQATLEVKTEEKRPVYAHATANVPWVDVSQVKLAGRSALILVRVPSVPYNTGQTLSARIRVAANGNQRFDIPLSLTVLGGPAGWAPGPVLALPDGPLGMPVVAGPAPPSSWPPPSTAPMPVAPATGGFPAPMPVGDPFADMSPAGAPPMTPGFPTARRQHLPLFLHLVPLLLLLLGLGGTVLKDLMLGNREVPQEEGIAIDPHPYIVVDFHWTTWDENGFGTLRFGVQKIEDPEKEKSPTKKLTFGPKGQTNSTVIKVDGQPMEFGDLSQGSWEKPKPQKYGQHGGATGTWITKKGKIRITQTVERIPGDPFIDKKGNLKRAIDTCFVRYEIENKDKTQHKVGLRVLLDTLIGANDAPVFIVANATKFVDEKALFGNDPKSDALVPDFIQALEKPSLTDPGVVARLKLRVPGLKEEPDKVLLTYWPGHNASGGLDPIKQWDVPLQSFKKGAGEMKPSDSCVVMYWDEKKLEPASTRTVGFTYGLFHLATDTKGSISASLSGDLAVDKKISVIGLVPHPKEGEQLELKLEKGLEFTSGSKAKQDLVVPKGALANFPSPITWNIKATAPGHYEVIIHSNKGKQVKLKIPITSAGIFGGS
jgi:hypothetical protein